MSAISSLKKRVSFFSLFSLVVMSIFLIGMHNLLAPFLGLTITNFLVYGAASFCVLRGLVIGLLSKAILAKGFFPVVDWINSTKARLHGVSNESTTAQDSVKEASDAMGVDISSTMIADEPVINAFHTGILSEKVVVFYRGLLQKLSSDAIRGVAFHEVAHAKNGDIFLTIFSLAFIQSFVFLASFLWKMAKWAFYFSLFEKDKEGKRNFKPGRIGAGLLGGGAATTWIAENFTSDFMVYGVFAVAFWLIATLIGQMLMSLISQNREYLADATAVEYGAGANLKKAFREMSIIENSGRPSSNTEFVARLGIIPASSFLSIPSHPKMEKRIENITNLMAGKDGQTAGGFMYALLVLATGMFVGWLSSMNYPDLPSFLGLPVFYYFLLLFLAAELFSVFAGSSETKQESETKTEIGTKIVAGLFVILILGIISWAILQLVPILGQIAWVYLVFRIGEYLLKITLLKNANSIKMAISFAGLIFTLHILSSVLFG